MAENGDWLTILETCAHFSVGQRTVNRWIADGSHGIAAEKRHGRWYIDPESITHVRPESDKTSKIADLQARLTEERKRADQALANAARFATQLEDQTKQLEWHTTQEAEKDQKIGHLEQKKDELVEKTDNLRKEQSVQVAKFERQLKEQAEQAEQEKAEALEEQRNAIKQLGFFARIRRKF